MKFALVSHVLPPMWSGQSVVLYRLLKDLNPDQYCLISWADYSGDSSEGTHMPRLPARYWRLPPEFSINRGGYRFGPVNSARAILNASIGIATRGRRIAKIVKREGCEAIVSCSGDLLDPPAAYFASRLTGVPYYPYFFDYYAHQFIDPRVRALATFLEPYLVRGAKDVIVPNETLAEELRRQHGVQSTVIHNPCNLSQYSPISNSDRTSITGEIKITYTGAVYEAHFDAFKNLLTAIEALDREIWLHVYTALPREYLEANGIRGRVIIHGHVPTEEIPSIQRKADILFLPLAFDSPYPEIIRTSAPGKLGEYLAAGKPVLAHAPTDCFVSWYFRRHECGTVVDRNDPMELARAIDQLIRDGELRRRLSHNARQQAAADFSIEKAQKAFYGLLNLDRLDPAEESQRHPE